MKYATTNATYKDISLLLYTLMQSVTSETPFFNLALGAFGGHYSAMPTIGENVINYLIDHVLSIDASGSPVEEKARSLFLAVHILRARKRWDARLRRHEDEIVNYCERISDYHWLRSSSVAALFLLAFASHRRFQELSAIAQQYLESQMERCSETDFPVVVFGLSLAPNSNFEVDDQRVRDWLSRRQKPFVHLCLLAVALHRLEHTLLAESVCLLQDFVFDTYANAISPNLSTIRILLAVIHMAEIGQSGEEIEATLRNFPLSEDVRDRVSAVIRADSRLFVEFRDGMLAQSPILSHLAFYLFAASELSIRDAYIIPEPLKNEFDEFRKFLGGMSAKVVSRRLLAVILILVVGLTSFELFRRWWPLANEMYDTVLKLTTNALVQSLLDDVLKGLITLPLYAICGLAMAAWLRGSVRWKDLAPGCFWGNLRDVASSIGGVVRPKTR